MTPRSSRWLYKRWPAFVLAAILLGTGLVAVPASVATAHSTRASSDECTYEHTEGSRTGHFKCGTVIYKYTWPDYGYFPYNGRKEAFGVGGDGIVYHAWEMYPNDEDWDGWWPLGGHGVAWGVESTGGRAPGIKVLGGDSVHYCKWYDGNRGDWTYWYPC
jgi:hypothetical protein